MAVLTLDRWNLAIGSGRPLTVIAGYIESMADWVLAPSPDLLALIYSEFAHLQHLFVDLRSLRLSVSSDLTLPTHPLPAPSLIHRSPPPFVPPAAHTALAL